MTDSIETRLARLEAAEQIRNLKARYCRKCDDNLAGSSAPADIAALFTGDGVWDAGPERRFCGRSEIAAFFASVPGFMTFALHHATNPEIHVAPDATSATGRFYLLQMATLAEGNRALWILGHYEDEFVRVGGEWLFSRVHVKFIAQAPYETGWAPPSLPR